MQKVSGALGLFVLVVAWKLGCARLLTAMSAWMIGPPTHLWVVKASSHLHTSMAIDSPVAVIFIMFLLAWDLYACPQTLAIMTACLRSSALIRTLVFFSSCKLCLHSVAVHHLTMEAEKQKKKWTAKISRRRLLLWMLWSILTAGLSSLAIAYQVAQSIPGSLQAGKILSLALKTCIGAAQGMVGNFIVPVLASKMTSQKHVFTTVSNLLMNFVIPIAVIIYLDTGCLGRWVLLWKTCRSNSQLFRRRFSCSPENEQDCHTLGRSSSLNIDIMVLRPSNICDPCFVWSSVAMSRCIHISLLRLQEIWLTKFITTGLVMPGVALIRGKLPTDSGAVMGTFGIYMAYALVSSGHLPLMNLILFLPSWVKAWLPEWLGLRSTSRMTMSRMWLHRWWKQQDYSH